MSQNLLEPNPLPPPFVMWKELPEENSHVWERQWFGHELEPDSLFNIRGIGIREPLFNTDVHRPLGTGDWLIMLFHEPSRLERSNPHASHPALTLVIWPPKAEQFYSWGKRQGKEPHSWMHLEGSWVAQQIKSMRLPVETPFTLPDDSVMIQALHGLLSEMRLGSKADSVIMQNFFENWVRGIHRQIRQDHIPNCQPHGLARVRQLLDSDYRRIPPLDELAALAGMSRSYLCHQFRENFGTSISQYVVRKRMAAAQRLLYEVHLRPGEIGEAVGYPDIYQFSKQFKKSFGMSPSQYRKQIGQ